MVEMMGSRGASSGLCVVVKLRCQWVLSGIRAGVLGKLGEGQMKLLKNEGKPVCL